MVIRVHGRGPQSTLILVWTFAPMAAPVSVFASVLVLPLFFFCLYGLCVCIFFSTPSDFPSFFCLLSNLFESIFVVIYLAPGVAQ